uniref:ferroxidase n=1 Tax=Tanacetum cinerariifolium TaxID=118510 RepID=A0A699GJ63_TANCI|nr:hypothetical protein [Tanacetum cinerariifolium]
MNTMLYERTSSGMSMDGAGLAWRAKQFWRTRGRKAAPLTAIVAVHGVLFWMMSNGMLNQAVQAVMPKVVNVSFVASPEPLKPEPTPPKTVPVVTKVPTFIPPMPVLPTPQTQPTITVAPPTPRTSEPSTPVATAPVSAPTPAPAAPAAPKTITGVEYIRAPQPVYPNIARRMGESGVVLLRVLIGEKGQAEQVVIQKSSGSTNLDEAGRQAVLRALYKPYIEDGKAIPVYALRGAATKTVREHGKSPQRSCGLFTRTLEVQAALDGVIEGLADDCTQQHLHTGHSTSVLGIPVIAVGGRELDQRDARIIFPFGEPRLERKAPQFLLLDRIAQHGGDTLEVQELGMGAALEVQRGRRIGCQFLVFQAVAGAEEPDVAQVVDLHRMHRACVAGAAVGVAGAEEAAWGAVDEVADFLDGNAGIRNHLRKPHMKGDAEVIRLLNAQLTNELTAINQYFLHARMYRHWGLEKIAKKEYEESIGEMKHADKLIDRILMLDGLPNLQALHKIMIGENTEEMIGCDLKLEKAAHITVKEGIATAEKVGDYVSRDLLLMILEDTEEHIEWLETQLDLIAKHGHRAAQHQAAGQPDHVFRIAAQEAAVIQRQRKNLDDHRQHDEHVKNAHVHARALGRDATGQHHVRIAHDAGPRQADAHHRHEQQRLRVYQRDAEHAHAGQRQADAVRDLRSIAARKRHQRQRADERHEVIERPHLPGQQTGIAKPLRGLVGGAVQGGRQRQHDVLPIAEHRIPLEQLDPRQLAHGRRHVAERAGDIAQRVAPAGGTRADLGQLVVAQRMLGRGLQGPQHRRDGKHGADQERGNHDMRNMAAVHGILVHAHPHQQRRRQVCQRLAQSRKGTLREKTHRVLAGRQLVAHECAVRLHGDVVGRVQYPQQAGGHPQRGAERHGQQTQAAQDGADQKIWRAPSPARDGAVAHGADQRLHQQPGHRTTGAASCGLRHDRAQLPGRDPRRIKPDRGRHGAGHAADGARERIGARQRQGHRPALRLAEQEHGGKRVARAHRIDHARRRVAVLVDGDRAVTRKVHGPALAERDDQSLQREGAHQRPAGVLHGAAVDCLGARLGVGVPLEQVLQFFLVDLDDVRQVQRLERAALGHLAVAHVQIEVALRAGRVQHGAQGGARAVVALRHGAEIDDRWRRCRQRGQRRRGVHVIVGLVGQDDEAVGVAAALHHHAAGRFTGVDLQAVFAHAEAGELALHQRAVLVLADARDHQRSDAKGGQVARHVERRAAHHLLGDEIVHQRLAEYGNGAVQRNLLRRVRKIEQREEPLAACQRQHAPGCIGCIGQQRARGAGGQRLMLAAGADQIREALVHGAFDAAGIGAMLPALLVEHGTVQPAAVHRVLRALQITIVVLHRQLVAHVQHRQRAKAQRQPVQQQHAAQRQSAFFVGGGGLQARERRGHAIAAVRRIGIGALEHGAARIAVALPGKEARGAGQPRRTVRARFGAQHVPADVVVAAHITEPGRRARQLRRVANHGAQHCRILFRQRHPAGGHQAAVVGDVAFGGGGAAQVGGQLPGRHDGFGLEQHARRHDIDDRAQRLQQLVRLRLVHAVGAGALPQERGGIEPERLDAAIGQAQHHCRHLGEHLGVGPVQVPLVRVKRGPHPAAGRFHVRKIARCNLRKHLAQRAFVQIRQIAVGEHVKARTRLRVAGLGGQGPRVVVGHVVEDQVRTQAHAGRAQLGGQRLQVGVAAQRGIDVIEAGDGKAAVVLARARTQEWQQVQVRHAQLPQVRDALRDAAQIAAELLHVGAVPEHALAEKPVRLRSALRIERMQIGRALRMQVAEGFHQVAVPAVEPRMVAIQTGEQPVQHGRAGGQAFCRLRAQCFGEDRQQAVVGADRHRGLFRHAVIDERIDHLIGRHGDGVRIVAPRLAGADHAGADGGVAEGVGGRHLVDPLGLAARRVADIGHVGSGRAGDFGMGVRGAARDAQAPDAVRAFQFHALGVVLVGRAALGGGFVIALVGLGLEQRHKRADAAAAPFHAAFQLPDGVDVDRRAAIERSAEQDAVRIEGHAVAHARKRRQVAGDAVIAAHRIRCVIDLVVDHLLGGRAVQQTGDGIGGRAGRGLVGGAGGFLTVLAHARVQIERTGFIAHVQVRRRGLVLHVHGARAAAAERSAHQARGESGGGAGSGAIGEQGRLVAAGLHQVLVEVPGQRQLLVGQVQACRRGQLGPIGQFERLGQLGVVEGIARVVDRRVEHHGGKRQAVIGLTAIGAGGERVVAGGAAVAGEDAGKAAAVVGGAEVVRQIPAVAQVERTFQAQRVALDMQAVVDVGRDGRVVLRERDVARPVRRIEAHRARIDARDFRDLAVHRAHRHRQRGGGFVVQVLERDADKPVIEIVREVAADLAAAGRAHARIAHAFAGAVVTADEKARPVGERRAVVEVVAGFVVAQAPADRNATALFLAGLGDEVDDAARRVGGQGGRGTAAHHFQVVERAVDLDEAVGRGEVEVAELQHRQAVFLDLHVARAAGRYRHAAHGDVGIAFTTGRLGAHARHGAQHFGRAQGRGIADGVRFQGTDRHAGLHLGRAERGAGDDHAFHVEAIGGSGCGSFLGVGAQVQHGGRDGCGNAAQLGDAVGHGVSSVVVRGRQLERRRFAAFDQFQQRGHQRPSGFADRLLDGGQRRMEVAGQFDVVVAHHRHLPRHEQAVLAHGVDRLHGQQVGPGKDAVERHAAAQQFFHRLLPALGQERYRHQQFGIDADAGFLQRAAVTGVALPHFRQVDVAKEGDAAAALRQQVGHGQFAAGDVVAADRAIELLRQLRAPHDNGHVARGQLVQLVVVAPLADQDDADHAARVERCGGRIQFIGIHARDQHVEAQFRQGVGQAAQHAEEKRIGQVLARAGVVRDHHADGAVLLHAQVLRADIDGVLERARQLHDAHPRLFAHQLAAGQRARDGGRGHAGQARNVGHLQTLLGGGGSGAVRGGRAGGGLGRCHASGGRQRVLERRAFGQLVEQARQVGVVVAPGDVREAEREPAQRATDGHVGQRVVLAGAVRRLAQFFGQRGQAQVHLAQLARDPLLALLLDGALDALEAHGDGRIEDAVGQRFPALDVGAVAAVGRQQLAHGRERVEVFDHHARIDHHAAIFHEQAGHFTQRVELADGGIGGPDIFQFELVVEFFFRQHDAYFADIRTGEGTDEFHGALQ